MSKQAWYLYYKFQKKKKNDLNKGKKSKNRQREVFKKFYINIFVFNKHLFGLQTKKQYTNIQLKILLDDKMLMKMC